MKGVCLRQMSFIGKFLPLWTVGFTKVLALKRYLLREVPWWTESTHLKNKVSRTVVKVWFTCSLIFTPTTNKRVTLWVNYINYYCTYNIKSPSSLLGYWVNDPKASPGYPFQRLRYPPQVRHADMWLSDGREIPHFLCSSKHLLWAHTPSVTCVILTSIILSQHGHTAARVQQHFSSKSNLLDGGWIRSEQPTPQDLHRTSLEKVLPRFL